MNQQELVEAFRKEAKTLKGIDVAVYESFGLDPCEPVIGQGNPNARIAIFGRDPGKDEIRWRMPFIGAGGQKVRQGLYQAFYQKELVDFQASKEIGSYVFWANTVPYKPLGNKAWSQKVKSRFKPFMEQVLLTTWNGTDILTLGREAFLWFGLGLPKVQRAALEAFWQSDDRFETSLEWQLGDQQMDGRRVRLHPLPHPSPLNATWFKKFPELLMSRLEQVGFSQETWSLVHKAI